MIVSKVLQSIRFAGHDVIYGSVDTINVNMAGVKLPCCYVSLLSDCRQIKAGGQWIESATFMVAFVAKTEYAFDSVDNESIIQRCRVAALQWLESLSGSDTLTAVSLVDTQRVYDEFDDIVTGLVMRVELAELLGLGCDYKENTWKRDLLVQRNGVYDVRGLEVLRIQVERCAIKVDGVTLYLRCGEVSGKTLSIDNGYPAEVEGLRTLVADGIYDVTSDERVAVKVPIVSVENEQLIIH